jgi:hypothetical protein
MHKTLTLRTNILLLALSALGCAAFVSQVPTGEIVLLVPFLLAGVLAGQSQTAALRDDPEGFIGASSWTAVRCLLMKSKSGFASMVLLWLNGAAVLALIVFGRNVADPFVPLAAYTAFLLGRELFARAGVRLLAKVSARGDSNGV